MGKTNISSIGCITVICIVDSSWLSIWYSQYHICKWSHGGKTVYALPWGILSTKCVCHGQGKEKEVMLLLLPLVDSLLSLGYICVCGSSFDKHWAEN